MGLTTSLSVPLGRLGGGQPPEAKTPPSRSACWRPAGRTAASSRAPLGFVAEAQLKKNSVHYTTVPQPGLNGRQGFQPRGQVLGGSSAINAMIYCRGHRSDYDRWRPRQPGWDHASVLPYFKRAEDSECRRHRLPRPGRAAGRGLFAQPFPPRRRSCAPARRRAWRRRRLQRRTARGLLAGPGHAARRRALQRRARLDLTPHLGRSNLTVLTHAQCLRLQWQGRRAGVCTSCGRPAKPGARAPRDAVGRRLRLAQLLMCSGVGPADQLQAQGIAVVQALTGVGRTCRTTSPHR